MPGVNNNFIISLVINNNCHNYYNRYELVALTVVTEMAMD